MDFNRDLFSLYVSQEFTKEIPTPAAVAEAVAEALSSWNLRLDGGSMPEGQRTPCLGRIPMG